MNKKTLKAFFTIGLMFLIAGLVLIYNGKMAYGVGFTSLGVIWAMISIGQIRLRNIRSIH